MEPEKRYTYMVATECMTYNQSLYIEETLKGFSEQKTTFPIVFGIVDDASTDGEQILLKKWCKDYLVKADAIIEHTSFGEFIIGRHINNINATFVVLLLKENHFGKKAKSPYIGKWLNDAKYIAMCEGDDYWIDPYKLQKQVDFMEKNPDYGMVSSASKIYVQGIGMKNGVFGHEYRGIEDLLTGNYYFNASVLKRKTLEERYNQEIGSHPEWKMGDWPRILHCAIVSKIGYIDEPMSVYRVLPNSASHFERFDKFKSFYENSVSVSKYFIEKYHLDSDNLNPLLDNWLQRSLLLKACSIGDVDLVKQYRHNAIGLNAKEKISVFISSHYITNTIYEYYKKVRLFIRKTFV